MVGVLLPGLCDPEDGVRGHLQSGLEVGLLVPNSGLVDRGRGPLEAGAGAGDSRLKPIQFL